jgi:hypothetical protein
LLEKRERKMVRLSNVIILVFTILIIVAFFMPWVNVASEQVGMVSKILTGKEQGVIDSISAFKVPVLANSPDARFMISVIKIFNPVIEDADKKSFLIWGIPFFAVVIFIVSYFLGKNRWVNLIIGLIGVLIFLAAVYKIKTTDLDKLVLKVVIGPGLWLTLWSYLLMGISGLMAFVQLTLARKQAR